MKNDNEGVPTVAQQHPQCLCSTRTQLGSPAQLSGLKDPAFPQLQCRLRLRLGSDPWPENLHIPRAAKKEKKRKKKKNDNEKEKVSNRPKVNSASQ